MSIFLAVSEFFNSSSDVQRLDPNLAAQDISLKTDSRRMIRQVEWSEG
jgi:hypothetical protein